MSGGLLDLASGLSETANSLRLSAACIRETVNLSVQSLDDAGASSNRCWQSAALVFVTIAQLGRRADWG